MISILLLSVSARASSLMHRADYWAPAYGKPNISQARPEGIVYDCIMEKIYNNDYKEHLEICQLTVADPEQPLISVPQKEFSSQRSHGYAFNLRGYAFNHLRLGVRLIML